MVKRDFSEINREHVGNAAEFYVAYKLSLNGWICAPFSKNVKDFDLLAHKTIKGKEKFLKIQVKGSSKSNYSWFLNKKHEDIKDPNLWYIFVEFNTEKNYPECFIAPSEKIAEDIKKDHKKYMSTPGKNGKLHKNTTMRRWGSWYNDFDKFRENWKILE